MIIDIDRAVDYFTFCVERHRLYERRQAGLPQAEWTDDVILKTKKFTQVFRWLDPGSQFVLTDLLPDVDQANALFRCTLYRYTNWPDTWRWLHKELGHYPTIDDEPVLLDALRERRAQGHQMFSGAYMIIPQPGRAGDKLEQVVDLTFRIAADAQSFIDASTQAERHGVLMRHYGVGKFLGQQILTDFMYEHGHPGIEDEFIVEGPGSKRGAAHLAPGQGTIDVIRWAHGTLHRTSGCPTLEGCRPTLMDVQNTLCEFSKYVKGPRNSLYRPAHPGPLPDPVIPTAYRK